MDDRAAKRITDALDREPGLIVVTGRVGGGHVRIYGRPALRPLERDFGPREDECGTASALAIGLAIAHRMALVIHFELEPAK